jgi:hypothetical protein
LTFESNYDIIMVYKEKWWGIYLSTIFLINGE